MQISCQFPKKVLPLHPKLGKYGKKKMALQGWGTTHGAGQAHHVFGK
jgi:hypothetical protein